VLRRGRADSVTGWSFLRRHLQQWAGPSDTIIQVQANLLASLATSLVSAFLAIHFHRHEGVRHQAQPKSAAQARWHHLILRPYDGVVAADAAGWALAPRFCPVPATFGAQYHRHIRGPCCRVVRGHFLRFVTVVGTAFESCPCQNPGARS